MECGLRTHMKEPVPLKHIEVNVEIQSHVATVNSTLQYVNEQDYPLEAVFVFPMPSGAALCQFSAKIADQEIVAELQEKQKAREKYDDALSSGEEVFLLEESEMSDDVFKLSVGSLPPGQNAAITFVYITELSIEADHSLRFCLPAVLNPRYTPAGLDDGIVSEITSVTTGIPYSLSFTVHMSSPNPIIKVESKSLLEPLMFLNTDHTEAKVSLCPGHMFDRDVELYLYYQNPHQLTTIVEAGAPTAQPGSLMRDPVVMISFYPEFPESVMSSMLACGEFVFVMDRSGSMDCAMHNKTGAQPRIECARDTLLLLLKSLPMGCFFNIYGFGSTYKSIFSKSVKYSQQTMERAVKKIKNMQADMGGTDILEVLEHIYKQAYIPKHPRQECQSADANGKLTVQYKLGDQEVLNTVHFSLKPAENSRLTIHRLGARSLIHSLERDDQDDKAEYEVLKSRVVELSKQCGVISSHTAFIAVHKGSGEAVKGPLLTSRISTTMLRGCALGSYRVGVDAVESSNRFSNLGMMRASPFDIFFPFRKISMPKWMKCFGASRSIDMMSVETLEETPESTKDDLLQLISLQKASGYWKMESKLAEVFGKTEKELVKQIPAQVNPDVWATLLALVWLHGFKNVAQVEWQFLAKKAVAWIRTQKVVNLSECIQVGNSLLGCQVEEDALGL